MKQKTKITFSRDDALFILNVLEKHEADLLQSVSESEYEKIPYFYHLWAVINDLRKIENSL